MQIKYKVDSARKAMVDITDPENEDATIAVPGCVVEFEIVDGDGAIATEYSETFGVVFTDPSQFDRFKPGEIYEMNLTRLSAGPFGE